MSQLLESSPYEDKLTANRFILFLLKPNGWALFLLIYFSIHFILRVMLSTSLQIDGAEQILDSQELLVNYGNFQPPLLTWIYHFLWRLVDPSVWSYVLIRYLILFAAFLVWHRVSLLLFTNVYHQFLAATSWLLLFDFSWKLHQGSSHTTLLMLALIMSLHAILLIRKKGNLRWYLYLGFAMGVGISSKYSYAAFVVCALVASLFIADFRVRLIDKKIISSFLVALLFGLPAMVSLGFQALSLEASLKAEVGYKLGGILNADFSGLLSFMLVFVEFTTPLWIIYLFIGKYSIRKTSMEIAVRQWFVLFVLSFALLFVLASFFLTIEGLKARWMPPFMFLLPFVFIGFMQFENVGWRRKTGYITPFILIILFLIGRYIQMTYVDSEARKLSRLVWPVSEAINQIHFDSFNGATIFSEDEYLAANLRIGSHKKIVTRRPSSHESYVEFYGELIRNDTSDIKCPAGSCVFAENGDVGYLINWNRRN